MTWHLNHIADLHQPIFIYDIPTFLLNVKVTNLDISGVDSNFDLAYWREKCLKRQYWRMQFPSFGV